MIRFFDIIGALFALIVLFPFMIPIIIGLVFTGEHKVFYLQPRIGKGGKEFLLIKFATMLKDSPNMKGGYITQKDDPRILPMGNFLRKTKINEVPQILNILLGTMSFVGPRPVVKEHLDLYSIESYNAIVSLKPGLTGIGSLIFRDEEALLDKLSGDRKNNHHFIITPYKGELEIWYKKHRNLGLYFLIIIYTIISVVNPKTNFRQRFKNLPVPDGILRDLL